MATENPVFQVLVTKGDQALLAAGNPVTALADGQLGVFSSETGLSIDSAVALNNINNVFIAVGGIVDGSATVNEITKSAGQSIQTRNVKSYTSKCYSVARPQILDITDFKAMCNTDYAIKLSFVNQDIYRSFGMNSFGKTFAFRTSCCTEECGACPEGSCYEVVTSFLSQFNNDPDGLFTAELFVNKVNATINTAPTADGTITVTLGSESFDVAILNADTETGVATKIVAAINATVGSNWQASNLLGVMTFYKKKTTSGSADTFALTANGTGTTANAIAISNATLTAGALATLLLTYDELCAGIKLTSNIEAVRNYCSINLNYLYPRGTNIEVSLIEGFNCNGVVTQVQELAFEEGSGYDIAQQEYVAGGFNGRAGIYRVSALAGMQVNPITIFASKTEKYLQFHITYDHMSVGGWQEYMNNLQTTIAVPCADTTTRAALVAVLDRIFSVNFSPLAGDVALCTDCVSVILTEAATNQEVDGISE